jgi:hypothetical protein
MSGRPDIMPAYPEEENASWRVALRFPVEKEQDALRRLCSLPLPGQPVAIKPRSWGARLFSWPWKPHHNVRAWISTGEIDFFEKDADDERVKFTVYGKGGIEVETARHA